jgi:acyl-coenzyme A thioesterase PaaI-like protein
VSAAGSCFYEPVGDGRFRSTPATAGPWSEQAQHGGPPAALLARALELLDEGPARAIGRFTMDLLGPVPVEEVTVDARVLRPGRTVSLRQAELADERGRVVARAQAWAFPDGPGPTSSIDPLPHSPSDGHREDPPASWHRGYLDAVEWQWIEGAVTRPGPAVVWMRPRLTLVPDEQMSPLQRLLTCVDSASGASAALDPRAWSFMNTELTVHLLRPPGGEWVCLDARTFLGGGSVGLATSDVYDEQGLVARSAQSLLVVPSS